MNLGQKVFKSWIKNVGFNLKPCPYPADKLQDLHLDWCEITQGFSEQVINELVDLWESYNEKSEVIKLIEQTRTSCQPIAQPKSNNDVAIKHKQPRNHFREYVKDSARTDEIIAKLHCLIGNKKNTEAIKVINKAMWIDWIFLPTAPSIKEEFDSITCDVSYVNRILDPNKPQKNSKEGLIVDEELLDKIREEFE